MDAIEFLKVKNRICKNSDCYTCILGNEEGGCQVGAECNTRLSEEQIVANVEKWASAHPIRTRESELLKLFPDAVLQGGVISICPRYVDPTFRDMEDCKDMSCYECRKGYWTAQLVE